MSFKPVRKEEVFLKTIVLFLLIGILYWIFDSIVDPLFFYEGTLADILVFGISVHEFYMRSSFLFFMIILGIISSKMLYDHALTIQEREIRFRKAVEEFPFAIAFLEKAGDPVFFNRKFTETLGYSLYDIPTIEKWWELAYPDEQYRSKVYSSWLKESTKVMSNDEDISQAEWKVVCKDASVKDIEFHFTKTDDDQGMLIFNDVTLRKEAEKALLLDESRLEALLELNSMMDATTCNITHFALEETVKLTQSKVGYLGFLNENESVITMYSWSKTAMDLCGIADHPIEYQVADTGIWGEPIRQRKPIIINDFEAENSLKKGYPEGHVKIKSHMGVPIFDDGRVVVIAGVGNKDTDYDDSDIRQMTLLINGMWNILKKKRDNDRLREYADELSKKNKELESIDIMKNEFLSNLTHELKTPLISIKGYGDLLFDEDLGPLNEDQKKSARNIIQSSERLEKRIDSLLCMQNVQSGNIQYDLDVIHIPDVIEKVLYEASLPPEKNLPSIKNEVAASLPFVHGNLPSLEMVFSHLIENAIKFTPVTGDISVSAYPENGSIHIIVQDNGIGIPKERIPSLFRLFYQLDGSMTRRYGGNGIGLFLCKSIVEGHGGTIKLESEPDVGTKVEVILAVMKNSSSS